MLQVSVLVFATGLIGASPTASPAPAATPRIEVRLSGASVFIDQATNGPGQIPPEGAAFANGAPAAPMTPYDWFSTAPLLPGVGGELQYRATATLHAKHFSIDLSAMASAVGGDSTNAAFWGEPLLGSFDPIEGHGKYPLSIVFPTHAGTNDVYAAGLQLPYNVTLRANDDRWKVAGGYVDTSGYDPFVFTQPAFASVDPSMNVQVFESNGPGLSDLDSWHHLASALPLLGADASLKTGAARFEFTDALLPMLQQSYARMTGGNAEIDLPNGARISGDVVHVQTAGNPITVPSLFGYAPTINPGAQGPLALSTLGDQSQTIAGVRGFFHPARGYDATVELGRAWYDASLVARPGSSHYGDFEHVSLTRAFNANDSAGIEYYRMSARYGTAYLPYGQPLNVWGIAWAYPGPWLKGAYQLVNDNWGGSNREGPRLHASFTRGPWTLDAAAYDYRQIEPSTYQNLTSTGFVEVDYLVLSPGDLAYGHTRGVQTYLSWKGARDTISLDYANDSQHRDYHGPNAVDLVDMRYPQLVLADRHAFSRRFIASVGYGRYQAAGMWTTTPVNGIYGVAFVGAQWDLGRLGQVFVQLRRYGVVGLPSIPGGPPPTFRGTGLVVDHHFQI